MEVYRFGNYLIHSGLFAEHHKPLFNVACDTNNDWLLGQRHVAYP